MTSRQDFYTSLILIVFSGAVVIESLRMPIFEPRGGTMLTAPGLVPGALGVILGLCGLVMLLRSFRGARPEVSANLEAEDFEATSSNDWRRLALILLLSLAYALGLVGLVPFWLATFIFVTISIAVFEWRPQNPPAKKVRLLGFALVEGLLVGLGVAFIFEQVFLVRLP